MCTDWPSVPALELCVKDTDDDMPALDQLFQLVSRISFSIPSSFIN